MILSSTSQAKNSSAKFSLNCPNYGPIMVTVDSSSGDHFNYSTFIIITNFPLSSSFGCFAETLKMIPCLCEYIGFLPETKREAQVLRFIVHKNDLKSINPSFSKPTICPFNSFFPRREQFDDDFVILTYTNNDISIKIGFVPNKIKN